MCREKLFLDTVATVQLLVGIEHVLKHCNRETSQQVLQLVEASLLRKEALKALNQKGGDWKGACRCIMHETITAYCAWIAELAPAIWSFDSPVVDHVICVLYKCSLRSGVVIGAATRVIVEELRRILTHRFGVDCDDAWWFRNDLITLSHTPDKVVLTLCQDEKTEKYLQWCLDTPCRPDTMRHWIENAIKEITSRVSSNTAVVG